MKKWQVLGTTVISASLILGACGGAGQSNDSKGNDSKGSDVEGLSLIHISEPTRPY